MSDRIPLSVLDLASVKQGRTPADAFANTLDLARHAEGWGYKRFWLAEHHNMPGIASSATAVLIGHVAGGTKSIRVGSGGVMLPNHAPIVVAEQFGTLAELYPGRIDLGLGRAPGTDPLTVRALRRPINAADDFPNQVQEILHYLGDVKPDQQVQAVPGGGTHVPVWLLGSSDFSAQLAGLLGLPYAFAAHFAPAGLWRAIDLYRNAFTPSDYLQAPYLMVCLPVVAAESDDQAACLATSIQQRILALVRGRPLLQPPPVETMDGLWLPHEQQGVENFLGELIVGSAATVGSRLTEFAVRSGVNEIMITSDLFDHADRLRSYELIMSVAPKLQSAG